MGDRVPTLVILICVAQALGFPTAVSPVGVEVLVPVPKCPS